MLIRQIEETTAVSTAREKVVIDEAGEVGKGESPRAL